MTDATRQAIIRAAREEGVDPSFALATAQRESDFNPMARNSKTIRGLFQMTGKLRSQYGIGDSDDAYTQAKGWARFIKDEKATQSKAAGRDMSDAESYAGHHFGGVRAGRMFNMDPSTPVDTVFTRQEMAQNPHFARAGTVGGLLGEVTGDIKRRQVKFGGSVDLPDFASFGEPVQAMGSSDGGGTKVARSTIPTADFSSFGTPLQGGETTGSQARPAAPVVDAPSNAQALPKALPDFSGMGTPV